MLRDSSVYRISDVLILTISYQRSHWLTVFPPQCCLLQIRFSLEGLDVLLAVYIAFKELDNNIVDNSGRN